MQDGSYENEIKRLRNFPKIIIDSSKWSNNLMSSFHVTFFDECLYAIMRRLLKHFFFYDDKGKNLCIMNG